MFGNDSGGRVPRTASVAAIALGIRGWPSTLMTRGGGTPPDNASRRNSFAAIRSRLGDNMNSIVLAGRIDSAIQERPSARDLQVRFVHPPGPIRDGATRAECVDSKWARYRWTQRQIVTWSMDKPRSAMISSRSR